MKARGENSSNLSKVAGASEEISDMGEMVAKPKPKLGRPFKKQKILEEGDSHENSGLSNTRGNGS